jgi:hypothetical protein
LHYAFVSPNGPPNKEADYPRPLAPTDDLPPITVITHVKPLGDGKLSVRGTCSDNGEVKKVMVNGQAAKAARPGFAEWEVVLTGVRPGDVKVMAHAEDSAGNVEKTPHVVVVKARMLGRLK